MTQPTIRQRVKTIIQSLPDDKQITASEICKKIKSRGVTTNNVSMILRTEDCAVYIPHGVNAEGKAYGKGKWRKK